MMKLAVLPYLGVLFKLHRSPLSKRHSMTLEIDILKARIFQPGLVAVSGVGKFTIAFVFVGHVREIHLHHAALLTEWPVRLLIFPCKKMSATHFMFLHWQLVKKFKF